MTSREFWYSSVAKLCIRCLLQYNFQECLKYVALELFKRLWHTVKIWKVSYCFDDEKKWLNMHMMASLMIWDPMDTKAKGDLKKIPDAEWKIRFSLRQRNMEPMVCYLKRGCNNWQFVFHFLFHLLWWWVEEDDASSRKVQENPWNGKVCEWLMFGSQSCGYLIILGRKGMEILIRPDEL